MKERSNTLRLWFELIGESSLDYAVKEELENGNYLPRALFLRGVARCVSDSSLRQPEGLDYPGAADALRSLLETGADIDKLSLALRGAQWQALWQVVNLLDDSLTGVEDLQAQISEHVQWRVFRVDETEAAAEPLHGLHEDLVRYLDAPQPARKKRTRKKRQAKRPNTIKSPAKKN
ncbi:MAG: hypothetical protein AAF715_22325 [Myxococcota bacterium]